MAPWVIDLESQLLFNTGCSVIQIQRLLDPPPPDPSSYTVLTGVWKETCLFLPLCSWWYACMHKVVGTSFGVQHQEAVEFQTSVGTYGSPGGWTFSQYTTIKIKWSLLWCLMQPKANVLVRFSVILYSFNTISVLCCLATSAECSQLQTFLLFAKTFLE